MDTLTIIRDKAERLARLLPKSGIRKLGDALNLLISRFGFSALLFDPTKTCYGQAADVHVMVRHEVA